MPSVKILLLSPPHQLHVSPSILRDRKLGKLSLPHQLSFWIRYDTEYGENKNRWIFGHNFYVKMQYFGWTLCLLNCYYFPKNKEIMGVVKESLFLGLYIIVWMM